MWLATPRAGIAGDRAPIHHATASRQQTESIAVERREDGRWRATYRLSAPTERLEFQRPANFYREGVWTVVTPGYELARDGDLQVLRATAGAAQATEIIVEFPEFTENLTAEYELFVAFSDDGRAIYTGHLYARPDERRTIRTLDLAPGPGEALVIRGGVYRERLAWSDEYGDGTYVFFGTTEPIETDVGIAVLDDGLPGWLREEFDEWLPRLFDVYRARFDEPLPWRPLVLFGYQPGEDPGYSFGGGTLTGLVQLTVTGDAWSEPSPAGRERALGFFAHEVAHLWNGQLTSNRGSAPWTHEGSADALSDMVLLELGVIDEAAKRRRETNAINGCFLRLREDPIQGSREPRVPYECGHVMALWTDAAIRRARPEADLLDFWAALVDEALRNEGTYDTDRYLKVVGGFGVSEETRTRMREAVVGGGRDPIDLIVRGLRAAGVTLVEGGEPTPEHRGELARLAMSHIMGSACDGRYSYNGVETFHTFPIDGCAPFKEALEIDRIDGLEVASAGDRIYDRVVEACAAGRRIALRGPGSVRDVRCREPLRPRRIWYDVRPDG